MQGHHNMHNYENSYYYVIKVRNNDLHGSETSDKYKLKDDHEFFLFHPMHTTTSL